MKNAGNVLQIIKFIESLNLFHYSYIKIKEVSGKLKNSLIDAVKELHPEYVFSVSEEESEACSKFLNYYLDNGGNIFSTNYDLLLYWILMRNNPEKANDGFG